MSGGETPGPAVDVFVFGYCAGFRVEEAARRAGISRATAYRLLRDPRVLEGIQQLRSEVRRRVVDRLVAAQDIAVAQLAHHAGATVEPTAASSVTAARALLAEGRAWVEVEELRQRVEALEDRTVLPAAARPVVLELLERLNHSDDEPTPDS